MGDDQIISLQSRQSSRQNWATIVRELRGSGDERRELSLQGVNTRLQHLGDAGTASTLSQKLIEALAAIRL